MSRASSFGRRRRVTRDPHVRSFPDAETTAAAWRSFKQNGDETLRNQLMEHYLYLVRYNAERIGGKLPEEVDVDDLMSAGIFGLMDAIDAFELERGVKFETYCAPRIRGAILDELRNMDWVPRLVRHRAHQLDQATRALEVELGRMPSDDEIARRLKMSTPQFKKVLKDANATSLISLNRKYTDSEADRDVQELDVISDDQGVDPVTEAQKKDLKLVVTEELSREERLIIVLYYYEEMTMKQIGDTLDLSESRVSQMHSSIVDRLRDKMQDRQREMAAG